MANIVIAVPDEADIEKAKQAAAGPLGKAMSRFPLLFAKVILIGDRPSRAHITEINNATITLTDLGSGPIGITCQHVIKHYRKQMEQRDNICFQIGHVEIDPLQQLIDEDARLDLATLHLTDKQVRDITSDGEIGSCVFQPISWPSPPVAKGDFIAFGGFPGKLRKNIAFDELELKGWSSGAFMVASVSEYQFISKFERNYWVTSFGDRTHLDLEVFGGMSGGPAFINRGLYWDLVGIISEYHENYDAMFFTSTRRIRANGTIEPPLL